jgi:putative transposase
MMSYKFRLYPTKEQTEKLELSLDICRRTYNYLLAELEKGFTKVELANYLLDLKVVNPEMRDVYSKVIQKENDNLFSNLSGLSASKKNGNKVGRLRFKGKGWKKTFTFNQSGFKLIDKKLHLSKIGEIKIKVHRNVLGNIKQVIIKREINKWYAIIQTDANIQITKGEKEIGLDFGLINFYTDNEGNKVSIPNNIQQIQKKLKKAHRNLSKKKKGSKRRLKAINRLQNTYQKQTNQKNDFFHKLSHSLVVNSKVIAIEDLDLKGLMMQSRNAKNYQISSWKTFITKYLTCKAESAGCKILVVDRFEPTTQKCSNCGELRKLELSERTYNCSKCGLSLDRDTNSAKNIIKYFGLGINPLREDSSLPVMVKESSMKREDNHFNGY